MRFFQQDAIHNKVSVIVTVLWMQNTNAKYLKGYFISEIKQHISVGLLWAEV